MEQFVIVDLKIQPNVKSEYLPEQSLIPYMQIYNAAVDQVSLESLVQITYALKSEGKTVQELEDREGETAQFFSGEWLVIIGRIPLQSVQPGKYELQINVTDKISNKSLVAQADFTVF